MKNWCKFPYKINLKEQELVNNFSDGRSIICSFIGNIYSHFTDVSLVKLFQITQEIKGNFIRDKTALIRSNLVPVEWRYDIFCRAM